MLYKTKQKLNTLTLGFAGTNGSFVIVLQNVLVRKLKIRNKTLELSPISQSKTLPKAYTLFRSLELKILTAGPLGPLSPLSHAHF